MSTQTVDEKLDDIALKQMAWKNQKMLAACLAIASHALEHSPFYPDALVFDFLLSDDDRNLIGSCWRLLGSKKLGIIEKTGNFRRSKSELSNGRTVFEYKLINRNLALSFVKRYNPKKHMELAHPQLNLGL